jgi:hypothetical protein
MFAKEFGLNTGKNNSKRHTIIFISEAYVCRLRLAL